MSLLKKLAALALALLMVPITAFVVWAEDVDFNVDSKLGILQSIGVLQKEDLNKHSESRMSRAEFAEVVVKLADAESVAQAFHEKRYSYDVDSEYYESAFINAALVLDLMTNDKEIKFSPLGDVTYAEAVRAMVKILGYDSRVKQKTDAAFLSMAGSLKILKGIERNEDGSIDRGDIYRLIANSMDIKLLEPLAIEKDTVLYFSGGQDILGYYHEIVSEIAVIQATEFGAIGDNKKTVGGKILAGNVLYSVTDLTATELLGYRVKLYYRNDSEPRELVYCTEYKNEVLTVSDGDIIDYNNRVYTYYDEDGDIKTESTYGMTIVYNGSSADGAEFVSKPNQGHISFIDYDNDGKYDVLSIYDYVDYTVVSVDADERKIYVKNAEAITFEDDQPIRIISTTTGVDETLADLGVDDIITALVNVDGTCGIIYHNKGTLSGQLTTIRKEGDRTYVTIDDREYIYTQSFAEDIAAFRTYAPKIGGKYTYKLNHFGNIAGVVDASSYLTDYTYGVAVGGEIGSALHKKTRLQIFSVLGVMEIFGIKEKCVVDDSTVAKPEDVIKMFLYDDELDTTPSDEFVPQPIRFKINADNEITHIDRVGPYRENQEGLYEVLNASNGYAYQKETSSIVDYTTAVKRPTYALDTSSFCVQAPFTDGKLGNESDLYKAGSFSSIKKDSSIRLYKADPHNIAIEMAIAPIVLVNGEEVIEIPAETTINIFLGYSEALTQNGEVVTRIRYSPDGTEKTIDLADNVNINAVSLYGTDETYAIQPGDVFRFNTDSQGLVNMIQAAPYNYDKGSFLGVNKGTYNIKSTWRGDEAYTLERFWAVDLQDKFVKMSNIHPIDAASLPDGNITQEYKMQKGLTPSGTITEVTAKYTPTYWKHIHNYMLYTSRMNVLKNAIVYDRATNKVSKLLNYEIRDYLSVGEECSQGFVWMRYGDPRKLIFFK